MIDAIDKRILSLLGENGRVSFAAIGEAVGLSPHGAADRVRRLERDGVILGYTARVQLASVGRGLEALVDIRLLPSTDPDDFERVAQRLSAVREIDFVTGRFDYLLRLACRDADDLDQTIRSIRREGGASATETRIVMRSATVENAL